MKFRFTISNANGTPTSLEVKEPLNWRDTTLSFEREHATAGNFIEYTPEKLLFHGETAYLWLDDIVRNHGYGQVITCTVEVLVDGVYTTLFDGRLDLLDARWRRWERIVEVSLFKDNWQTKLADRRNVTIDLLSGKTPDGEVTLKDLDFLPHTITLHRVPYVLETQLQVNPANGGDTLIGIATAGAQDAILHQLALSKKTLADARTAFPCAKYEYEFEPTDDATAQVPVMPLFVAEYDCEIEVTIDYDLTVHPFPTASSCYDISHVLFVTDYDYDFLRGYVLTGNGYSDFPSNPDFDADEQFLIWRQEENASIPSGGIDHVGTFTDTIPLKQGQAVWCVCGRSRNIGGGGFSPDRPNISFAQFDVSIREKNITAETGCDVVPIWEVLFRSIDAMTDGALTDKDVYFKSDFYGRTNLGLSAWDAWYDYDENGEGAFLSLTNGFLIRRFPDRPLELKFEQLLDALVAVHNVGMGILYDDSLDAYVIRVEPRAWFFQDNTPSIEFPHVKVTRRADIDRFYTRVVIGYDKWATERSLGLDDIHAQREYVPPGFSGDGQTIELVCPYIASRYAIELTREKTYNSDADEQADWRFDEEVFLIQLGEDIAETDGAIRDFDQAEQDEYVDTSAGVLNIDAAYNLVLNPARMMRRHLPFVVAPPTSARLVTTKIQANAKWQITWDGDRQLPNIPLLENSSSGVDSASFTDIAQEKLPYGLELVEFKAPLRFSEYISIRNNPVQALGFTEQTDTQLQAFIDRMQYEPAQLGGSVGNASFVVRELSPEPPYTPTPITKAIEFDGINDEGSFASTVDLAYAQTHFNDFSLAFWLKMPAATPANRYPIGFQGFTEPLDNPAIYFRTRGVAGGLWVDYGDYGSGGSTPLGYRRVEINVVDGSWHHIVVRYSWVSGQRPDTEVFVDGVPAGVVIKHGLPHANFSALQTINRNFIIAERSGVNTELEFADFVAKSGQISNTEIAGLYNNGCGDSGYPVSDLLWRVHCNETTGTLQTDVSGNGANMALTGFPDPLTLVNGPCP